MQRAAARPPAHQPGYALLAVARPDARDVLLRRCSRQRRRRQRLAGRGRQWAAIPAVQRPHLGHGNNRDREHPRIRRRWGGPQRQCHIWARLGRLRTWLGRAGHAAVRSAALDALDSPKRSAAAGHGEIPRAPTSTVRYMHPVPSSGHVRVLHALRCAC